MLSALDKNSLQNALRGGIALVIAIFVGQFGHVEYRYWLLLTTIVVIQPNFGATLLRAKQRTISTILGVSIGAMIAVLIHSSDLAIAILLPILFFLAVITIPYSYAYAIFFVTIGLMLLLSHGNANTWDYVFMRLYDTMLGVIIGLGCSLLIWPSWARLSLDDNLCKSIKKSQKLFMLVTQCLIKKDPNPSVVNAKKVQLEAMIEKNRQFLEQSQHEVTFARVKLAPAIALVNTIEKIASILNIFHMLSRLDLNANQPERTTQRLIQLQKETTMAFDTIINNIKGVNQTYSQQEVRDFLKLIEQSPTLESDASIEQQFLHRNINMLRAELNHLFQASLLLKKIT